MTEVDPNELISADEVARLLRVKEATLTAWRNQERGPAYLKIGRFVHYRRRDICEWLAAQRHCPMAAA
jgi:predicted DNA-binding transcriptional regulator AlpA